VPTATTYPSGITAWGAWASSTRCALSMRRTSVEALFGVPVFDGPRAAASPLRAPGRSGVCARSRASRRVAQRSHPHRDMSHGCCTNPAAGPGNAWKRVADIRPIADPDQSHLQVISSRSTGRWKADDGSRTRDLRLGKPTLYQLSYVRKWREMLAARDVRSGPVLTPAGDPPAGRSCRSRGPRRRSGRRAADRRSPLAGGRAPGGRCSA
jgi:hypothetical protein